jgi:uncharacterized membrane protein
VRLPAPRVLVTAAATAYAAGFGFFSVRRHDSFETGRFDLGNMAQAVWSTAHGHPLRVTDLHGKQVSRLAAHVDPILVVFAPLWRIWPSPDMLLLVQAVAIAAGAFPVFALARKHLGSERAALGFALVYLFLPAVQWLTLNEFHPVALACPLLLFAFRYLDDDRLVPFAVFALLAAAAKEEVALVVVGFGVWYAISRRRPGIGATVAAAGAAWFAIAVGVVVPHFNHGSTSSFYSRYRDVGGSPGGVLRTAVTHPGRLLRKAFDARGLRYLADLAVPVAGFFLAAPLVLVAALPELGLNLLAATKTQQSIHFHYTAALIPPLVVASVLGAARLARGDRRRAAAVSALAVVVALAANLLWLGALRDAYVSVSEHDRIAARALRVVPPDAVVSATNTLGAHLSARRRILSYPLRADARWIAVDETHLSYGDRSSGGKRAEAALAQLRRDHGWRVVFARDGVLVFRRSHR